MEGRPLREVVHDLNNELGVIALSAELASGDLAANADAQEHLDRIGAATRAAQELIAELGRSKPRGPSEQAPHKGSPSAGKQSERSVLVVDDSATMRQLIAYALEPGGFDVSTAAGGEEALGLIGPEAPDLLLTDVQMPAMSGPQLAAEARSIRPELPILFVTGDADGEIKFDGGAAPALRKPFVASELVAAIWAALER